MTIEILAVLVIASSILIVLVLFFLAWVLFKTIEEPRYDLGLKRRGVTVYRIDNLTTFFKFSDKKDKANENQIGQERVKK
ncbi:MAG: hypothetical protein LBP40_04780 [Campylobacteraceae bacterium]|jgi:hypothetical protein|nr:hypothetical protein [Campylobacteraceae bacterium]